MRPTHERKTPRCQEAKAANRNKRAGVGATLCIRIPEMRASIFVFSGSLLLFLTLWKGQGGYTDIKEYLDDAENLWMRGDMSVPNDYVEVDDPADPDNVIRKPKYNRYAVGLAIVSGP